MDTINFTSEVQMKELHSDYRYTHFMYHESSCISLLSADRFYFCYLSLKLMFSVLLMISQPNVGVLSHW